MRQPAGGSIAGVRRFSMSRVSALVRLGRPIFLVGGVVLYGVGAAVAGFQGARLDWERFAWGQLAVSSIQAMTHYANDFFDLEADRANRTPTRWSGGSRVLPNGELAPRVALVAAAVLAGVALFATLTLYFVLSAESSAALALVAALALAWAYSAPPLRLHSRGLGEIDTAVVTTLLVPFIGYHLQAARIDSIVVAAVAPLFLLQFAMLLAVEFPDEIGDAAVGKRTLVVRLGRRKAGLLYACTLALHYVLLPVWTGLGLPAVVAVSLVATFPVGIYLSALVTGGGHRDSSTWNRIAFLSTALLVGSALLELVTFVGIAEDAHGPPSDTMLRGSRRDRYGQEPVEDAWKARQRKNDSSPQMRAPHDGEHGVGRTRISSEHASKLALVGCEGAPMGTLTESVGQNSGECDCREQRYRYALAGDGIDVSRCVTDESKTIFRAKSRGASERARAAKARTGNGALEEWRESRKFSLQLPPAGLRRINARRGE
jgi:1,4-dihydroxy-2-naphthoate polyprenyltransferase